MQQPHEIDGLPVGRPLPQWTARPEPEAVTRSGDWCWIAPLSPAHDEGLVRALVDDGDARRFTYLAGGLTPDREALPSQLEALRAAPEARTVALGRRGQDAEGLASFLRIDPANGSVEIGGIVHGPGLARSTATTEAMYLLAAYVFDELGYRRYEWKCDSLNAASRRAAERLGFRYEGTWRNAIVYKGRSRDTAWYSVTDEEWPAVKRALETWLQPSNFVDGGQVRRLEDIRAEG